MKREFLNVDLEIASQSKLKALATAMGEAVITLHCGPIGKKQVLVVENAECHPDADTAIHALCAVIEGLPPAARRLWAGSSKEFDAGYELNTAERVFRLSIRPDTLGRMASLGAVLTVTCYNHSPERKKSAAAKIRPRRPKKKAA